MILKNRVALITGAKSGTGLAASVILFLSSDESSFMTGAAVAVDGGWSAR